MFGTRTTEATVTASDRLTSCGFKYAVSAVFARDLVCRSIGQFGICILEELAVIVEPEVESFTFIVLLE